MIGEKKIARSIANRTVTDATASCSGKCSRYDEYDRSPMNATRRPSVPRRVSTRRASGSSAERAASLSLR
jgi:hypothetical protein